MDFNPVFYKDKLRHGTSKLIHNITKGASADFNTELLVGASEPLEPDFDLGQRTILPVLFVFAMAEAYHPALALRPVLYPLLGI